MKTKIPSKIAMISRDNPWMDSSVTRMAARKLKLYCKCKTGQILLGQQRNWTPTLIPKNKATYFHKENAELQDVATSVNLAWWSIVKPFMVKKYTLIEASY